MENEPKRVLLIENDGGIIRSVKDAIDDMDRWIHTLLSKDRAAAPGAGGGAGCPDGSLLSAYAEARLQLAERQQLEVHLADCEQCLSAVAFLLREAGEKGETAEARRTDPARVLLKLRLGPEAPQTEELLEGVLELLLPPGVQTAAPVFRDGGGLSILRSVLKLGKWLLEVETCGREMTLCVIDPDGCRTRDLRASVVWSGGRRQCGIVRPDGRLAFPDFLGDLGQVEWIEIEVAGR